MLGASRKEKLRQVSNPAKVRDLWRAARARRGGCVKGKMMRGGKNNGTFIPNLSKVYLVFPPFRVIMPMSESA